MNRLWDGLMASKLQFNTQGTTGYVFPTKATKSRSSGPQQFCYFSLVRTKHWLSGLKEKKKKKNNKLLCHFLTVVGNPVSTYQMIWYIFLNPQAGSVFACRTQPGSNNVTKQFLPFLLKPCFSNVRALTRLLFKTSTHWNVNFVAGSASTFSVPHHRNDF